MRTMRSLRSLADLMRGTELSMMRIGRFDLRMSRALCSVIAMLCGALRVLSERCALPQWVAAAAPDAAVPWRRRLGPVNN